MVFIDLFFIQKAGPQMFFDIVLMFLSECIKFVIFGCGPKIMGFGKLPPPPPGSTTECKHSYIPPSQYRKCSNLHLGQEGGCLLRLSIFSLKITRSLFLFKTKLQHKNSKTLWKTTCCELKGMGGGLI